MPRTPQAPGDRWRTVEKIGAVLGIALGLVTIAGYFGATLFIAPDVRRPFDDPVNQFMVPFQIRNPYYPTMYNLLPTCGPQDIIFDTDDLQNVGISDIAFSSGPLGDIRYGQQYIWRCPLFGAGGMIETNGVPVVRRMTLVVQTRFDLHIVPGWPWTYGTETAFTMVRDATGREHWIDGRPAPHVSATEVPHATWSPRSTPAPRAAGG